MKQTKTIILSLLIVGIGTRLIPHYPNFTAVGAISLLGAAFASRRSIAIIIPFLIMLFSDMILNNLVYARLYPEDYKHFIFLYRGALWSYAAFGLVVIYGHTLFRNGIDLSKVLFGSLGASLIFFILSNFGVWASTGAYPVNFGGLMSCYIAGLPFMLNQVLGDLFFSLILFGVALHVFELKPRRHIA
ncbi:MAG TPA: DUF6580 family putative transport protein [Saprospiraceae bacterium]|nr:DUF6580 family putative transport protein [Saprospiraceae bacterium]